MDAQDRPVSINQGPASSPSGRAFIFISFQSNFNHSVAMDPSNNTPFIFSEIPPNRRQSSARSFVTASRIGDRTSSGVSTTSITTPTASSMGHSSASPSSATRNQSFHQTFIENWIYKNSNQQEIVDDLHNEQDSDTDSNDLPPWASPRKPNTSWYKPNKSFNIAEVNEEEEEEENDNANSSIDMPHFLSSELSNDEKKEHDNAAWSLSFNEYSVMATNPTNLIPLSDDEQEEELTAEYKTASTALRSPDIIHRDIDQEYENELIELCKPHAAPSSHGITDDDSQDTIPYGEDDLDDGDTQPYNTDDEDTQPYNPDTQLTNQLEAPDSLPELPYEFPKDDFAFMPEFDDSDYVSPLASLNGDNETNYDNASLDALSPIPLPYDEEKQNDQSEDDLFDDITENDILQCEQEVALKMKHTHRAKRKAESPIPVAPESQIVRLDKKQIRTSIVKKPTTIDDYFLHPATINSQTGTIVSLFIHTQSLILTLL
ncbi:hypothetical protein PS15m_002021 [Mucor circinelloides]